MNVGLGRRIVVVGTTGSGKTTMAAELAARLGVPHIELNALHWGPGWTSSSRDVFRSRVEKALAGERWVVDGNYHAARDLIWTRAETLVWLDYSLPLILLQLTRRTAKRVVRGTELWHGNRETIRDVFSRESIFLWALQTHRRRRREFAGVLASTEYGQLSIVRLRSPREARSWLSRAEAPADART